MRRIALLTLVVLGAAAYPAVILAGSAGSDNGTMCVSTTQLRSENEVPGSTSNAFGHSQIKIRNDATLEFNTHIVNDGESFVAGHVHRAAAGVAGPVVVPLFLGPATSADHITDVGEVTISETLAADICAQPEQFYVNYHSTTFPAGAVRGQLG